MNLYRKGSQGGREKEKEEGNPTRGWGQWPAWVELDQQGLVSLQLSHLSDGHDAAYLQVWVSWELNEKMHSDRHRGICQTALLLKSEPSPLLMPGFSCSCPGSPGSPPQHQI